MIHIDSLSHDDRHAAFELALAHVSPGDRSARVRTCLQMLESGQLDPRHIWIARRDDHLIGTQVCVPLGGAASLFWLPSSTDETADALLAAAFAGCRTAGCKLAQALATAELRAWAVPLERAGFRHITRLQQWTHSFLSMPDVPPSALRFERYSSANARLFAATLERTYDGTLDCPELNGVRSIDEVIAGHRAQGKFHPDFWWLAYDGAEPVGVLLLVEMPDGVTWELAYLGIVSAYRGRGLGRAFVAHALDALRVMPATRMTLAVDERNVPARRLYASCGFVPTEAHEVFLYVF